MRFQASKHLVALAVCASLSACAMWKKDEVAPGSGSDVTVYNINQLTPAQYRIVKHIWTDDLRSNTSVPTFASVDEGIAALKEAADLEDATDKAAVTPGPLAPARELLGEMQLEAGDASGALLSFEASMAKEPGRLRGAVGAASAADAADDTARAHRYYTRVLEIAAAADTERPELVRAGRYLARN